MSEMIDNWFVNRRNEQLKANSPGGVVVSQAHKEREQESNRIADEHVQMIFQGNPLLNNNVKKEDYDFRKMYQDDGAIKQDGESFVVPNKYRNPFRQSVAGFDLGTGRQELKTLSDADGVARKAVDQLRTSYTDLNKGRPAEDVFPLSQIALQSIEEGKTIDQFKKGVKDWPEQQQDLAWHQAQCVADGDAYRDYYRSGVWNTPDNDGVNMPKKFKHENLANEPLWINCARTFFERAIGPAKKELSNEDINRMALYQMSQFENNLTTQSVWASRVINSNDDVLKKAFYNMMVVYDNIDMEGDRLGYLSRGVQSVVSDPSTYLMAGAGAMAFRKLMGGRLGTRAFGPLLAASISAAPEGFLYGGFDSVNKQGVEVAAGEKEEIDLTEVAQSGAEDAALFAAFPWMIKGGVEAIKGVTSGTNALVNRIGEVASDHSFFPMPGSMKKQAGQFSMFSAEDAPIPQIVEPFYSRLGDSLINNLKESATGAQYLQKINSLASKGMFKKEELEWTGLPEYLELTKSEKLTKQEVIDVFNDTALRLEEVKLSGDWKDYVGEYHYFEEDYVQRVMNSDQEKKQAIDDLADRIDEHYPEIAEEIAQEYDELGEYIPFDVFRDRRYREEAERMYRVTQYTDPFIEYRHPFLHVSFVGNSDHGYSVKDGDLLDRTHYQDLESGMNDVNKLYASEIAARWLGDNKGKLKTGDIPAIGGYKHRGYSSAGDNYREYLFRPSFLGEGRGMPHIPKNHYRDYDRVAMHAMVSDLELPGGGKSLFIDEVQSDYHNRGKEVGYRSLDTQKNSKLHTRLQDEMRELDSAKYDVIKNSYTDEQLQAQWEVNKGEINEVVNGILEKEGIAKYIQDDSMLSHALNNIRVVADYFPDAVFENIPDELSGAIETMVKYGRKENEFRREINKIPALPYKDDYPNYVFKRMVREAADKDYDAISWSSGDAMTNKYDEEYSKMYKLIYDDKLVAEAKRLGKKYGVFPAKQTIEGAEGSMEIWTLPLTDAMKRQAKYQGFPLMQLLGGVTGGGMAVNELEKETND